MSELNQEGRELARTATRKLLIWLAQNVPSSKDYSSTNLGVNILTGAIILIIEQVTQDKDVQENIIQQLGEQMRKNFESFRNTEKEL